MFNLLENHDFEKFFILAWLGFLKGALILPDFSILFYGASMLNY